MSSPTLVSESELETPIFILLPAITQHLDKWTDQICKRVDDLLQLRGIVLNGTQTRELTTERDRELQAA